MSLDQISYWASAQTASGEAQVFCYFGFFFFFFASVLGLNLGLHTSSDKHSNTEQLFPKSSYFMVVLVSQVGFGFLST